jgi:hypothetical protein
MGRNFFAKKIQNKKEMLKIFFTIFGAEALDQKYAPKLLSK